MMTALLLLLAFLCGGVAATWAWCLIVLATAHKAAPDTEA